MLNRPIHEIVADYARMERENTTLRGLVANVNKQCHYCKKDLAHCPVGFPGCPLSDDLMIGEDECGRRVVARMRYLERAIAQLYQDTQFLRDGDDPKQKP